MDKKLLLTFDYELFLGNKSGTVDNCLIIPTDMLLNVMERNGAKAIFFVDTAYIMRMEDLKDKYANVRNDLLKIKQQLQTILAKGHRLYHHIHPHWIDAKYDEKENQWDLSDYTHYCLESLSDEKKKRLFEFSVSFLSELISKAEVNYTCCGYRAGGLHVEPFDKIKEEFDRSGICEDYSVDTPIENMTESYCFNESTLHPLAEGKYTEFPISRIRIYGLRKIMNGIHYRLTKRNQKYKKIGDGCPSNRQNSDKKPIASKFEFSLPISIELLTPVLLPYYKKLLRQYSYIHFLSHPKLQSLATINLLDKFLKWCKKNGVVCAV